jgi:hypothetical protein
MFSVSDGSILNDVNNDDEDESDNNNNNNNNNNKNNEEFNMIIKFHVK